MEIWMIYGVRKNDLGNSLMAIFQFQQVMGS